MRRVSASSRPCSSSPAASALDAGLTVAWQEPVSAVYGHINQNKLNGQLKKIEAAPLPVVEQKALKALPDPSRKIAFLARSQRRHAKDGEAIGKIQIPRIGANFVVVNGTDAADLRKGPGSTRRRRSRAPAARRRSPGTARPTPRRSGRSTSSRRATGSS